MKKTFWFVLALLLLIGCLGCAKDQSRGETDPQKLTEKQIALMAQYPEYFGLGAAGGLDVYVWQFAEAHFSFGLLPHAESGRDWLSNGVMNLRGVDADAMRAILATYIIDEDDIHVIPWQNPLSSYLGSWQIVLEGEDGEAKKQDYVDHVRNMLLEKTK